MLEIRWRWVIVPLIVFCIWKVWPARALHVPPGSVAPDAPLQVGVSAKTIHRQEQYDLIVLADFDIEARVLSKTLYHSGREADLSPVDLALGWGAMSDT